VSNQGVPSFDLSEVKKLIEKGHWRPTNEAAKCARELEFDGQDIVDCIRELVANDFYKTMESITLQGTMQDVYRPSYCGVQIYLKLQIQQTLLQRRVVVISFKRK
jgi:hypothetical protein